MKASRMACVIAVLGASALGAFEQDGQCATPLTEAAISELIGGGVPPARLRQLIANCGIDLGQPDIAATELRLRRIGVTGDALTALAPPATARTGDTWVSPFDRRAMAYVPAGTFRMGSEPSERDRDADETAHDVTIANSYWMDLEEVTHEAFQRFLISRPEWQRGNVPAEFADANYLRGWNGLRYPDGLGSAPVSWVSWHAANAYAAWAGKRLPSEAEWEYAARAGSTSRYWWGNEFDPSRLNPSPAAAARRTNPWGLRDITGGLWEWTASLYRPYPYRANDGREDTRGRGSRAARGGSRINGEAFLRSANRNMEDSHRTSDMLGFRCVR